MSETREFGSDNASQGPWQQRNRHNRILGTCFGSLPVGWRALSLASFLRSTQNFRLAIAVSEGPSPMSVLSPSGYFATAPVKLRHQTGCFPLHSPIFWVFELSLKRKRDIGGSWARTFLRVLFSHGSVCSAWFLTGSALQFRKQITSVCNIVLTKALQTFHF